MIKSLAYGVLALGLTLTSVSTSPAMQPADQVDVNFYNGRLTPTPRETSYGRGVVVWNTRLRCVLLLPEETIVAPETASAVEAIRSTVCKYFRTDANFETKSVQAYYEELNADKALDSAQGEFVKSLSQDADFWGKKNAYRCFAISDPTVAEDATPEEVAKRQNDSSGLLVVAATDLAGLRDSFKTLRQLAETFSDTASTATSRYFIPELTIDDAPTIAFRGIHLCWFPETRADFIERSIRMASYYKFNYVVLEFWGVYPFEASDAFCWSEFHTSKEEVKRLVELGKSLGVELIPQINLFGHAPAARGATGKHTILDFHPEMEPLFEPDGWTWNVYNPAARELLSKCVLELYDVFDQPEYFHIGCDEAYSAGTSFIARRKGNYVDALADWITHFHDLLKEKNCRVMMWHDMLVESSEFRGYTVGGNQRTRGLVDKLPKDIVICDWQYDAPKENETWPTTKYFMDKGFDVLACPWINVKGIRSLGQSVVDKGAYGLLCTTWHKLYGDDMRNIFTAGANAAWHATPSPAEHTGAFDRHLRQILPEIEGRDYRTGGVYDWQVPPETIVPH